MPLIAFTNTKDHTVYMGNKSIAPGETREVEKTLLPSFKAQKPALAEPENPLVELLMGNVKSVLDALETLSDEDLVVLQELEDEAENPRKGVLEGLLTETLRRADLGSTE